MKKIIKTPLTDEAPSFEFIELPDGTSVSIGYNQAKKTFEKREIPPYTERISEDGKSVFRYRPDGTLWLMRQCDEKGQWTYTEYDKTGKRPVCKVLEVSTPKSEAAELVKSAELLSKKRPKNRIFNQKLRGE